ncbi:MAG: dipeptidase [Phycisphaerae bacterium]|nr:dipeptidase [Phycisphaerae bacterium]
MIDKVIAYIDENRQRFLDMLNDYLRIPSVSTDPEARGAMKEGAEWTRKVFEGAGLKAEIVATKGHAAVLADNGSGGGKTMLIYGHYDVQPTGDESLWHSPAFEPTVRDGKLYARGSADDKGQILAHMFAAQAWMKVAKKIPGRVKFLVEGEEEIGSPNLAPLIRDQKDRLACDYVALSDTPKFNEDIPAITYGTKGLIYKEIVLTGPKQNLHSGSYGGTLVNPGNALAAIIAALRDAKNRVTIPGFYDDVREPTDEERKRMKALPFDERKYAETIGVPELDGEAGYSTIERRWARPTLDVNGLLGGFIGEGSSTVIPARVMAKVSMRIVPNQDPEKIGRAFDDVVRKLTPKGVRLEIKHHASAGAYMCPLDSPGMKAVETAVERGFGKKPVFIREGGTLPILPLFKQVLGAESLMPGFCVPDCNAHGPNEFLAVEDFIRGIKTSAHLMQLMGEMK